MKNKYLVSFSILSLVLLSAAAVGVFIQGDVESTPASAVSFTEDKSAPQELLTKQGISADQAEAVVEVGSEAPEKGEVLDYANYIAAHEWISSRGYFLPEDTLPYESLPDEALENLIASGEILAMHVLADRLQKRFNDMPNPKDPALIERYEELLYTAAVHGSTAAIVRMGKAQTGVGSILKGESHRRSKEIMALAYFEVALMRGDRRAEIQIHHLKRAIERRSAEPFSESELSRAKQLSIELYNSMVAARSQIPGYDAFDNSVPDYVKQYYDNAVKAIVGS